MVMHNSFTCPHSHAMIVPDRSRMDAPFMFRECPVYHQPPAYRHNPEDMFFDDESHGGADAKLPRYVCSPSQSAILYQFTGVTIMSTSHTQ